MGLWSQRIQTKTSEIGKYLADQCAHQQVFNYRCCEINVVSWRRLWRSLSPQPPLLGTSVAEALTLGGHFPGLCTIRQPLSTPRTSREQDTIKSLRLPIQPITSVGVTVKDKKTYLLLFPFHPNTSTKWHKTDCKVNFFHCLARARLSPAPRSFLPRDHT